MARIFDHLVLCVADLERARATYRALGFSLTPVATHPFGTRNSLVQLAGLNFLEVLEVPAGATIPPHEPPHRFSFAEHNRRFVERHAEGMSMLVFIGSDSRADAAAFKAAGLTTYEPFDFGRDAKLPDGSIVRVAFSLAFVTHAAMPHLAFFTCHQRHAPELFWKPEYQRHDNGAQRVVEVVMSAADPEEFADFFARLTGGPAVMRDGALLVGPESDRITVLPPALLLNRWPEFANDQRTDGEAAPAFVGFRITTTDMAAVRRALDVGGTPYRETGDRIIIPPSAAHDVAIEFSPVA